METMYIAASESAIVNLEEAITATDTSMTVSDGSKLPPPPNLLVLGIDPVKGSDKIEVIRYGSVTGNVLGDLTRGFNGSTASNWPAATPAARTFTQYDHNTFKSNIEEINADYVRSPWFGPVALNPSGTYVASIPNTPTGTLPLGFGVVIVPGQSNDVVDMKLLIEPHEAVPLKKSDGTSFAIGDLQAGRMYPFRYNGTDFLAVSNGGEVTVEGTATAADILAPKTATTPEGLIEGTIPTKGDVFKAGGYFNDMHNTYLDAEASIDEGFYPQDTAVRIQINDDNFKGENIKAGVVIFGETGTYVGGASNAVGAIDATIIPTTNVTANQVLYVRTDLQAASVKSTHTETPFRTERCFAASYDNLTYVIQDSSTNNAQQVYRRADYDSPFELWATIASGIGAWEVNISNDGNVVAVCHTGNIRLYNVATKNAAIPIYADTNVTGTMQKSAMNNELFVIGVSNSPFLKAVRFSEFVGSPVITPTISAAPTQAIDISPHSNIVSFGTGALMHCYRLVGYSLSGASTNVGFPIIGVAVRDDGYIVVSVNTTGTAERFKIYKFDPDNAIKQMGGTSTSTANNYTNLKWFGDYLICVAYGAGVHRIDLSLASSSDVTILSSSNTDGYYVRMGGPINTIIYAAGGVVSNGYTIRQAAMVADVSNNALGLAGKYSIVAITKAEGSEFSEVPAQIILY